MKLTLIEKQMLGVVLVLVIAVAALVSVVTEKLNEMDKHGGLKAALSEIWNGNTNSK